MPQVGVLQRRAVLGRGAQGVERHARGGGDGGMHLDAQHRHAMAARDEVAGDAQERVRVAGGAQGDDEEVGAAGGQSSDLPTRSRRGCQWSRMSADTTMWLALPMINSRGTTPM